MDESIQPDAKRKIPFSLTEEIHNRHEFLSLIFTSFKSKVLHRIYGSTTSHPTFRKHFLFFLQKLRVIFNLCTGMLGKRSILTFTPLFPFRAI